MRWIARIARVSVFLLLPVQAQAQGPPKPVFEASGYGVVRPWFEMGWAVALAARSADAGGPAQFVTLPWYETLHRAELWQVSASGVPWFAGYLSLQYHGTAAIWADVDGDGRADLVCGETSNQGTVGVEVFRMGPTGLQTPGEFVPVETHGPIAYLTFADVNADGRMDIGAVSAGSWYMGRLFWLVQGTPGAWTVVHSAACHRALAADLDGDGTSKLVDWVFDSWFVSELNGDGSGTFVPQPGEYFGNGDIQLHDLDGDGRLDMISGKYAHRRNEAGGFTLIDSLTETVSQMVDLDHDGHPDLVAIEDGHVGVAHGSGGFGFTPFMNTEVGSARSLSLIAGFPKYPQGLSAVADANGDGWTDVVTAGTIGGELDVIAGRPGGGFTQPRTIGVGTDPEQVALADVDHDGRLDLVVLEYGDHRISVRHGAGDGTFGDPFWSDVLPGTRRFALGDFNGDGRPDLAAVTDSAAFVSVLPGTGNGFGTRTDMPTGGAASDVAIADLNEDGLPDLCVDRVDGQIETFRGLGSMGFVGGTWTVQGLGYSRIQVGDLDGDGHVDLVTLDGSAISPVGFRSFRGDGHGNLLWSPLIPSTPFVGRETPFVLAPIKGDGRWFLVYANRDSVGSIHAHANAFRSDDRLLQPDGYTSDRTWGYAGYPVPADPRQIEVADVNRDGIPDMLVLSRTYGSLTVIVGRGNGLFDDPLPHVVGFQPSSFAVGDVNGDGLPDAVVADAGSNDVMVLRNLLPATAPVTSWPNSPLSVRVTSALGALQVRFAVHLVSDAPATLDTFDAQGRKLSSQPIAAPAAGNRDVLLHGGALAPGGLIFVRIAQAGAFATTRLVIVS